MDRKQLTEYLKNVAEMEASVYRQGEIVNALKEVKYTDPIKNTMIIKEPVQPVIDIEKPTSPEMENKNRPLVLMGMGVALSLMGVVLKFLLDFSMGGISIGMGILFIIIGVVYFISEYSKYAKNRIAYSSEMKEYEKKLSQAEAEHPKKMEQYKREFEKYKNETQKLEKEYEEQKRIARHNFELICEDYNKISSNYEQTKDILEKLYLLDIIFPKYREMAAMCTIYEYFASGRCSELEGPNGAYNLYESELRQNLIINKLDTIYDNLEIIKNNQYILYREMQETNNKLGQISEQLQTIVQNTQEIKEISAITAYCSQITAQNTEALKYIALVK